MKKIEEIINILKRIAVYITVRIPLILALCELIFSIKEYAYPAISTFTLILTLLTLIPSVAFIVTSQLKPNVKNTAKKVLFCLCVIMIPFSLIFSSMISTHSETTDFTDYRDLDPDCLANRDLLFGELFPTWPHYFENVENENGDWETVYLDSKYYYHYYKGFDYTYDIYAEWSLDSDDFDAEIKRVKELFDRASEKFSKRNFIQMEKGEYSCLIRYRGDEPFQKVTESYEYLIFAYNESTKTVRYICCDSLENGVDQPYYLSLDW
ncbi:MAG: hypothetical protein IJN12_00620 [Clostridia bacterium]|nr:hypothetical protein [Clostridia bacterium]